MVFPGSAIHSLIALVSGATLAMLALNATIRFGLRAPRIRSRTDPSDSGLPFRNVRLPTANNKHVHGWLVPANRQFAPTLVVLHGWGGNSEMMLPLADPFYRAGYALFFIDARNHGASDSDSFSSLPRFAEDLESALDWLQQQPETDPGRIGLIGHSLGAAAALLLASRRRDVAAVVSLASFAHPEGVMRRFLATRSVPFVPFGWYTLRYVQRVIGHRFADIAPQNTIRKITCPVLLAHGREDTTVPVEDAHLILAGSGNERTHLLLVAGEHEDYSGFHCHAGEILGFVADAMGKPEKARSDDQSGTAMPSSNF